MKTKYQIIEDAVIKSHPERKSGGQTVGIASRGISLRSEEVNFYIEVEAYRRQSANRDLALTLFELYLDEVLKN